MVITAWEDFRELADGARGCTVHACVFDGRMEGGPYSADQQMVDHLRGLQNLFALTVFVSFWGLGRSAGR